MEGPPLLKKTSREKKLEYATHFLKKIEDRLEKICLASSDEELEKKFTNLFRLFERLSLKNGEVLYREARVYYQIAVYTHKKIFLVKAIRKLEKMEKTVLENSPSFLHLYGQLLISLSMFTKKEIHLEEAIKKLEQSVKLADFLSADAKAEIHWDLARAWIYLGSSSSEVYDTRKGIDNFTKASLLNFQSSHFWIDFAEGLCLLSMQTKDISFLETAVEYLKKAILESDPESQKASFKRAWKLFLSTKLKLVELDREDISSVDSLFFEAITSLPDDVDLWLRWGEFYLRQGWLKKDLALIEKGLEKITTPKISTLDPLSFSAYLGCGLAMLGLFIDDLKVIKEGEKRIDFAQKIAPKHKDLLYASGLSNLILGLYFSDEAYIKQAFRAFSKGKSAYPLDIYFLHGLFEAILSLAVIKKEDKYFKKALTLNEQLSSYHPDSFIFHYEGGLLLMQYGESNVFLLKKALLKFEKALGLKGADLKCLYHYATALDTMGFLTADPSYYEMGIDILTELSPRFTDKGTTQFNILYRLAFLYTHLGEVTEDIESLYKGVDLFESIAKRKEEDEIFFCGYGYALLNLSYLLQNSNVEKSHAFRCDAEAQLIKALELGNKEANYHLACLYSLSNRLPLALEYLAKAKAADVLPLKEDILHDVWLESVSKTADFDKFLESLKK